MATLNIKGLPDPLYSKLKARAKRQRRSVAQEVIQILGQTLEEPEPLSLLQLEGLGKGLWRAEPVEHVAEERQSWDVRTTVDIEDDVLQAARELARNRRSTLGKVLSDLARTALEPRAGGKVRNGVPVLPRRPHRAPKPTMELVNRLRDEA